MWVRCLQHGTFEIVHAQKSVIFHCHEFDRSGFYSTMKHSCQNKDYIKPWSLLSILKKNVQQGQQGEKVQKEVI